MQMLELIKLQELANSNKLPHALLLNGNQQSALYLGHNLSRWLLCNNRSKNDNINEIRSNNINNIILNINKCACASCKLFITKNHPDYYIIDLGENEEIKIEHIRIANQFIVSNLYLSSAKILLINHIHNINLQAVNAFLKNLEEPSLNFKILILLITNNYKVLPNTILSRVIKINLFNFSAESPCNKDEDTLSYNLIQDTYIENFNIGSKFTQQLELESIILQDLHRTWLNNQMNVNELVTKWQTIDKNQLIYCLWSIIIKLIKPHEDQLLLNLSQKISPKNLWLLLDSLNYLNKSIILGIPINWELFLYNFIITKFTGENVYVDHLTGS